MLPEGKCRYIDGQIYPDGNFYVLDTQHIKHNGNELKSALNGISTDISNKVDKETGKGLSTNDYTTAEKNKLSGIEANANNYVHPTTSGNKHIPSGGSSGKILGWSANGTAAWIDPASSGGAVDAVYIGSTEYAPDANGKVTLPTYPTTLPASDVYSWAKASSKPSYTADEISSTGTTNQFVTSTEKNTWNNKGTYSKPSNGIPKTDLASAVQTSLGKADTALQSYTETDPTVPSWAKASSKPSYTASEVGLGNVGNFKAVSTAASQGLSDTEKSNARANIGAGTGNGTYSKPSGGIPKTDLASAVQTSLGKADTALQSHQTIKQDGITGATVNRFGTCSTAAATAAKTVSITSGTFSLEAGARVSVKFTNANTADTPTLNVNSKGAKNIFSKGSQITTGTNKSLLAGTVDFIYDGTQWHLIGNYIDTNTTYSNASTSAAGLMSAADKTKLNGIATGAQVNSITGVKGDAESSYRTGNVNLTAANIGAASSSHTHNYAGSSSAGGAATSANKLNIGSSNIGSGTQPVYFDATTGKPVATTYTLAKSVPSDAKFTDTTYSAATQSANGLMSANDKCLMYQLIALDNLSSVSVSAPLYSRAQYSDVYTIFPRTVYVTKTQLGISNSNVIAVAKVTSDDSRVPGISAVTIDNANNRIGVTFTETLYADIRVTFVVAYN